MGCEIKKVFLLIILILLQSCSGGRIGNFLESSFKNVEESKIKKETKNNLKNNITINSKINVENKKSNDKSITKKVGKNDQKHNLAIKSEKISKNDKNNEELKIKKDAKSNQKINLVVKSDKNIKNNKKIIKNNISFQKKKYQPQSYKIIFILKDVDPKDPTEDLRTILRNSDVNFEIEKIERFFDPKNKINKRN